MNLLLTPSVKFINKLSYPKKLILLFSIFFLFVVALTFQTIRPILKEQKISKVELQGLILVERLYLLRKIIFTTLNESQYSKEEVEDKINDAFNKAFDLVEKIGSGFNMKPEFEKILLEWDEFRNFPDKYVFVNNQVGEMISDTCDKAYLPLESSPDIYYLADIVCTKFNNYRQNIATLREVGVRALNQKSLSLLDRGILISAKTTMDVYKTGISKNMNVAMSYNPSITSALLGSYNDFINEAQLNNELMNTISANNFTIDPDQFLRENATLLDKSYVFCFDVISEAYRLISDRINHNNNIILFIITVGVLGLLLFSYLFAGIYQSILSSVKKLLFASKEISKGNLNVEVNLETQDELNQVGLSFNVMKENLKNLVKNIKTVTQSIQKSSEEIAIGNTDLAKRTILEAASIEETSTSMKKIAESVKINAESAKDSYSNVQVSREVALQSAFVVNEMVKTMNLLNQSARQITDIIAIIEDVSFRTNLLALNASVEAVNAGEHGRSFGVVAEEIRNLSKRSGDSAQGIRGLISSSLEQINEGTRLADQTLAAIENINRSVNSITQLTSNIKDASIEQNTSIQQIDIAINEIEKVTHANSALVEEAAAAARSLQNEVKELNALVEVFKVIKNEENKESLEIHPSERPEKAPSPS